MLKHVIQNNVVKLLVKLRVDNILMKLRVKQRVKIRAFRLKNYVLNNVFKYVFGDFR